jgi:hypothetical protein
LQTNVHSKYMKEIESLKNFTLWVIFEK